MKHSVPSIVIERRALLREGLAALLHDTRYKVIATLEKISDLSSLTPLAARPTLILLGLWDGIAEALKAVQKVGSLPNRKVVVIAEFCGHSRNSRTPAKWRKRCDRQCQFARRIY